MERIEDRVAVVTGAASGLGLAIARSLGSRGCRLMLADIEEGALESATASLRHEGIECAAHITDVSDAAAVEHLAAATLNRFGAAHILCNNAGVSARRSMIDSTLEDFSWVLGVVLWGCIHGIHSFLPILMEQDEAHIVNVSSMAGLLAFPMGGPYNAGKAAIVSLSETLFLELQLVGARVGITVVCPGGMKTAFLTSSRNRPVSLVTGHERPLSSEVFTRINERSRQLIEEEGMPPEEVAAMVVDAVRSSTFSVLTHRELYEPAIRARVDNLLLGRPPSPVAVASVDGPTDPSGR